MNKKNTGALIKEARHKKNYTQIELGDLVGVTNKAVSRWEKGDSFPDSDIIEKLAEVLDLKIQDIIVGKIESDDEENKVIENEKEVLNHISVMKKIGGNLGFFVIIGGCILSGYNSVGSTKFFFQKSSVWGYTLIMLLSFIITLLILFKSKFFIKPMNSNVKIKLLNSIVILSFIWIVGLICYICSIIILDRSAEYSLCILGIGKYIKWQLGLVVVLNILVLGFELYMYLNREAFDLIGWFIAITNVYMCVVYVDWSCRLDTFKEAVKDILLREMILIFLLNVAMAIIVAYRKIVTLKSDG